MMNIATYKKRRDKAHNQRGVATIEVMIVTPVVLVIMLAVAEFGHALGEYNTLTQSVRDGARYIAEEASGEGGVVNLSATKITETRNLVAYGAVGGTSALLPGLSPDNVTVTVVNSDDISVTAAYVYQPIFVPASSRGRNRQQPHARRYRGR